jgi:uncharacterized protein (TIGR02646 family)
MIKVDRNNVAKPNSLITGADEEHSKAHGFYMTPKRKGAKDSFNHTLYQSEDVRMALSTLFNGKCSYCECKVSQGMRMHIEHFRPKSLVEGIPKKEFKGYYWLSADWQNLFYSCQDCNSRKVHEEINGNAVLIGKQNYFGLSDVSKRGFYDSNCSCEEDYRLLLNPCIDNVDNILDFEEDGTIKARSGVSKMDKQKIEISKKYFALIRIDLQRDRAKKYKDVISAFENLISRLDDFIDLGHIQNKRLVELVKAFEEVQYLLDVKESPYIAVAREAAKNYKVQYTKAKAKIIEATR